MLFDAPGRSADLDRRSRRDAGIGGAVNPLNPETISLVALVLGMLLIALVSIGGFTVLAQRRLRSIGMLESTGATDRHVRLVVRANGAVVGVVGAILGFVWASASGWFTVQASSRAPTTSSASSRCRGPW